MNTIKKQISNYLPLSKLILVLFGIFKYFPKHNIYQKNKEPFQERLTILAARAIFVSLVNVTLQTSTYLNIVFVWSQYDGGIIDKNNWLGFPPKPKEAKLNMMGGDLF